MMPWGLLLNPTVLLGLALAGASAFGWFQTVRLGAAQDRIVAVQARFDQFKASVASEGRAAQVRAEAQRKADLQRAKEADNEAKKRYFSLDAQYAAYRLRQRAGNGATSRIVPAATAGAPDGNRVCYTRDTLDLEITGALGRLRGELAEDIEPYDRATVMARICRDWALNPG